MCDRYASHGFIALAPDLYRGRVATDAEEASHLMSALDWDRAVEDVREVAAYLRQQGVQKVAVMGFCMGGALTLASAVRVPVDAGSFGAPLSNQLTNSFRCLFLRRATKECRRSQRDQMSHAIAFRRPRRFQRLL